MHARADLPLGNKLDDMLFQIVKFREDKLTEGKVRGSHAITV